MNENGTGMGECGVPLTPLRMGGVENSAVGRMIVRLTERLQKQCVKEMVKSARNNAEPQKC